MNTYLNVAVLVTAYLIGGISPAIILGKIYGVDIRKTGSGNAGTTNVLRTLGGKAAVITLVVDILKGVVAVILGKYLCGYDIMVFCALLVFLGHIYPIFFNFKGGKGVATAFGALLAINPLLGLIPLAVVAVFTLISKRMSVGSLIGAFTFPFLCYFIEPKFLIIGSYMALIIIFKHGGNITRILKGEEPPMSIFVKKNKK